VEQGGTDSSGQWRDVLFAGDSEYVDLLGEIKKPALDVRMGGARWRGESDVIFFGQRNSVDGKADRRD